MTISKNVVLNVVRDTLSGEEIGRSIAYWVPHVMEAGTQIKIGPLRFSMPFDGTMVFVDLAPDMNWAHPCLYIFISHDTRSQKVIRASFPPDFESIGRGFREILRFGEETKEGEGDGLNEEEKVIRREF